MCADLSVPENDQVDNTPQETTRSLVGTHWEESPHQDVFCYEYHHVPADFRFMNICNLHDARVFCGTFFNAMYDMMRPHQWCEDCALEADQRNAGGVE